MDQELVALTSSLTASITGQLRAELAASAAETRRHFDVVADRLMDKIQLQLVGESVIGVDQKLDRFRGEVAEEFRKVARHRLVAVRGAADVVGYPPWRRQPAVPRISAA